MEIEVEINIGEIEIDAKVGSEIEVEVENVIMLPLVKRLSFRLIFMRIW